MATLADVGTGTTNTPMPAIGTPMAAKLAANDGAPM
jgi:hypothetical protein